MTKLSEQLHTGSEQAKREVLRILLNSFKQHEPGIRFDLDVASDPYDNSIEIYVNSPAPYPYEPCKAVRDDVLACGFTTVFWNFANTNGRYYDEIRGSEPRRRKRMNLNEKIEYKYIAGVGYVDERYKPTTLGDRP